MGHIKVRPWDISRFRTTAKKYKIATPANWQKGEPVVISPSVSDEKAKQLFPQGWETVNLPSGEPYLRMTFVD